MISQWLVFAGNTVLTVSLAEVGFRFGLRIYRNDDTARKEQIGGIQSAILGLLALLLAFTFSMAVERYEQRRLLVIKEANAIGTTYLRASLLPDEHVIPVRAALRRYVDLRIKGRSYMGDRAMAATVLRNSAAVQAELWSHATQAARQRPDPITATFIQTLNDTIDTEAERVAAGRADIPEGVWILLILVAGSGAMVTGYGAGANGARTKLASWLLPLLITVVIVLIFDLSHPLQGMIDISQQPLVDLQRSLGH